MALLLGVDTGGTYTDAVLVRDDQEVIASAKALTTRHDLSIGIGKAIKNVLSSSGVSPSEIGMASLSTTLATNALVEGHGGRVGLIYIGFREKDLEQHGLRTALDGDPSLTIAGGHDHAGNEAATLDTDALLAWLGSHSKVSAFAVAAQFATRNPKHELQVAQIIQELTGKSVSCSHHLSAKLNGPKRALTALLNARLIGMIAKLIEKAEQQLGLLRIEAPLMVVRGDGALISAALAKDRPIETILSGPAASIVGARWLTDASTALVSDIGGTTTDVAVLRDGKPMIDPAGAQVGPWRTMVEAVAMRTTGLGGDSEIHVNDGGLIASLTLGPRRVVPISLLAVEAPDVVRGALEEQLRSDVPGEYDARFVRAVAGIEAEGLSPKDAALLARIEQSVWPLARLVQTRLDMAGLNRLVGRGLVQFSGATPSDASHVLGGLTEWDSEAADLAMQLLGRKRTGNGNRLCTNARDMAQMIVDQLTKQTSLALLETAFAEDDSDFGLPPSELARHVLMQKALYQHAGLIRLSGGLNVPVIGLGASAGNYYPAVGERLGCDMTLPTHAGVANAIGAVVGRVTIRRQGTITAPAEGQFRLHLADGPQDFPDEAGALQALQTNLEDEARNAAERVGAIDIQVIVSTDIRKAEVEARSVFVEAVMTVEASGRPRIAI